MIPELTQPPYWSTGIRKRINKTIKYLDDRISYGTPILDVGQENYLSKAMSATFKTVVDNTDGDLDSDFYIVNDGERYYYDVIVYSHTIEHQFSPLHTLKLLKYHLSEDGRIYIFAPSGITFKFLWGKGHYHEIDEYRMRLLIKRAGLKLISVTRQRVYGSWWHYLLGIRPLMRLITTTLVGNTLIYEVEK